MTARVMLTEDQVNLVVKAFLESRGWVGVQALAGNQAGIDVTGNSPWSEQSVHVESKGGTSGRPGSARFGRCFGTDQVRVHLAEAVFTAVALRERDAKNVVLIAVPDDNAHLSRLRPVEGTLKQLRIGLLAVSGDGARLAYGQVEPAPSPAKPPPLVT